MAPLPPLPAADLAHALGHARTAWEGLRGGRVLLTGGTGFFGCWLAETFLHAAGALRLDARLTVLTRDPAAFARKAPHLAAHPALALLPGDVRSFPDPAGPFTHVIHAASPLPGPADPAAAAEVLDVILTGTRRVVDWAAAAGARRLLLVSSGAVYGRQPPDLPAVPEDYPGAPPLADFRSAYGEGKRAAELYARARAAAAGLGLVVARGFAFVGPHLPLDGTFAVGNFLRDGLAGRPITVAGDGTAYRSYLYAADLAVWLWTLLVHGRPGEAYNVGSDEPVSIADLARAVARATGAPGVEVRGRPVPGRPADRYVPCTRKAREELGLRAGVGLDDALARTAAWLAHPPGPPRTP